MNKLENELNRVLVLKSNLSVGHSYVPTGQATSHTQYGEPLEVFVPHLEIQNNARKELKSIYKSSSHKQVRKSAGQALGYSKIGIFAHEHPGITATAAAIATSIIVYESCIHWDKITEFLQEAYK